MRKEGTNLPLQFCSILISIEWVYFKAYCFEKWISEPPEIERDNKHEFDKPKWVGDKHSQHLGKNCDVN